MRDAHLSANTNGLMLCECKLGLWVDLDALCDDCGLAEWQTVDGEGQERSNVKYVLSRRGNT